MNTMQCLTRIRFALVLRKKYFSLDDKFHFCRTLAHFVAHLYHQCICVPDWNLLNTLVSKFRDPIRVLFLGFVFGVVFLDRCDSLAALPMLRWYPFDNCCSFFGVFVRGSSIVYADLLLCAPYLYFASFLLIFSTVVSVLRSVLNGPMAALAPIQQYSVFWVCRLCRILVWGMRFRYSGHCLYEFVAICPVSFFHNLL